MWALLESVEFDRFFRAEMALFRYELKCLYAAVRSGSGGAGPMCRAAYGYAGAGGGLGVGLTGPCAQRPKPTGFSPGTPALNSSKMSRNTKVLGKNSETVPEQALFCK